MCYIRASIVTSCKLAKCWGGGEKEEEIGEAEYKLTVNLELRNFVKEISKSCVNSE
jgi:hypothetical protein